MSDDQALQSADVVAAGSFLDRVRRRHSELQQGVYLTMEVPGFNGLLAARFRRVSAAEWDRGAKTVQASPADPSIGLDAMVDTLISCCVGVHGRDGDRDVAICGDGGPPPGFDRRLARALGIDGADEMTARQVVYTLLGRDPDGPVFGMYTRLDAWSRGLNEKASETLQGESPATLP